MSGLSRRRLLAPAAYSEAMMPSLQLAKSSRVARMIAKFLFFFLVVAFVLVAFAPWQQSVKGKGSVVAYAPDERQQVVEAQIKGRIVEFGPGIVENARVAEGQLILRIQDVDPGYMENLESQRRAVESTLIAARAKLEADKRRIANNENFAFLDANQRSYENVRERVIAEQNSAVESAKNKVSAMEREEAEAVAAEFEATQHFNRHKQLYEEEIVSLAKFQNAQRKYQQATEKAKKAKAYVLGAKNDLEAKVEARNGYIEKAQVEIDNVKQKRLKQESDLEKAKSDLQKTEAEIAKAEKELTEMEIKISRQRRGQEVLAPMDGVLTQITPNRGTQSLKPGDKLCVIVPDTEDRAVQVWLDGNDAPLVEPGRHVRLQFEGWPAVQFAGWPSVAVGTFGGEVISVDAIDNGKGKFRVLIKPDPKDDPWPGQPYLRQGVRANGWVLLKQVPLWFEIWRQMNGFPPVVSPDDPAKQEKDGDKKKPKLPKA